ncbi:MAG: hypothetical protein ACR2KU_14975 [Gammaproteobacteria bacterium]
MSTYINRSRTTAMYVKSFLLAVGLFALTGCAAGITIPSLSPDHPANPHAAAAPLPAPPSVPEANKVKAGMREMKGMQGMDHDMQGMPHAH